MNHEHSWHFIRTFIADGKPKVMQRLEVPPVGSDEKPKVMTWMDARQEYALYHCPCGVSKNVEIAPPNNTREEK